jgi:hypothetical protein
MRTPLILLAALTIGLPAAAQDHAGHGADAEHAGHHEGGVFPEGWSARTDRDQPVDEVMFMTMGDGYHAITGPAAVLYNPEWAQSGDYSVSARFTQTTAPEHPEAYGIIIGGTDLDGADQAYTYFLVRKTGEYFIATRRGAEREIVVPWTAHDAVVAQDDDGGQVNTLGASVEGDEVVFTANGQEVARLPKGDVVGDGVFGFRINHRLDVHIDQVER